MKKIIILVVSLVLFFIGIYWFYSHSYIEVSASNGGNIITYSYKNQGNNKNTVVKSNSQSSKKLVSKGDYEVTVSSSDKSSFTVIKTKGFFGTTRVNAKLIAENSRKFIGENPSACTSYLYSQLVSYSCGDYYANLRLHIPETDNQPAYVSKLNGPGASGRIEGLISYQGKNYAVIYGPSGEEQPLGHRIYQIRDDFSLTNGSPLTDLDKTKLYSFATVGNGFAAYDSDYKQALYYSSQISKPNRFNMEAPTTSALQPYSIDVKQDVAASLYSSATDLDSRKSTSEVVISGNKPSHFIFKKTKYTDLSFCGDKKLCLLGGFALDVYDISTGKATLSFTVNDVAELSSADNKTLIINKTGVLNLDVDKQEGFYEYRFGDYKYSQIQPVASGYVLNLTSNKNRGVALLINPSAENSDTIDKKIADLQKSKTVSFVSVSGNYIYVSANMGEPIYSQEYSGFIDNPVAKKSAAAKINAEIDKLGIDRNIYKISSNAF